MALLRGQEELAVSLAGQQVPAAGEAGFLHVPQQRHGQRTLSQRNTRQLHSTTATLSQLATLLATEVKWRLTWDLLKSGN